MTPKENVAPQLDYLIQKQPNDQNFCFVMVEKSAGADRKQSLRKIRSHTLKQFHRRQRLADDLPKVKSNSLPMLRGPLPPQPLPSSLEALPLPIEKFGHLRSYIQELMSRNGAGKTLYPLLAEDPALSYGFEFFAQSGLDAVRFIPPSANALAIKTAVLREFHKRLLENSSNINLLVMMLLLAGTSISENGQGSELETHVMAIHRLVRNCGGLATLDTIFLARVVSLHVLSLHADFSKFPSHMLLSREDCLRAKLDDMTLSPDRGNHIGWPSDPLCRQFCQNMISNPISASTELVLRQRVLQKRIFLEVDRKLSNPDTTYVSKCYQLTVRIIVCMAISGVGNCEDLIDVAGENNSVRHVIKQSISQLVHFLQKSDIHDLWNDQDGLLHWLVNVVSPLCRGLPENGYYKALQIRLMIDMSCTQRSWYPVLAPMVFFIDYQAACSAKFWKRMLEHQIN